MLNRLQLLGSLSAIFLLSLACSGNEVKRSEVPEYPADESSQQDMNLQGRTLSSLGNRDPVQKSKTWLPGIRKRETELCRRGNSRACNEAGGQAFFGLEGSINKKEGLELLQRGCLLKNPVACGNLTQALKSYKSAPEMLKEAVKTAQTLCKNGFINHCVLESMLYETGVGLSENPSKAMEIVEQACSQGDCNPKITTSLAQKWLSSTYQGKHNLKAWSLLSMACRQGQEEACNNLAGLKYKGLEGVVQAAPFRAISMWIESCARGGKSACLMLEKIRDFQLASCGKPEFLETCLLQGGWLAVEARRHESGPQISADELDKLCQQGASCACGALGKFYAHGWGVPLDPEKAFSLYQRGCKAGCGLACHYESLDLLQSQEPAAKQRAANIQTALCQKGMLTSCFLLAIATAQTHPEAFRRYAKKSCDAGDAQSCHNLAIQIMNNPTKSADTQNHFLLLKKACDLGHVDACAAVWVAEDKAKKAHDQTSLQALHKACYLGLNTACTFLAKGYQRGGSAPFTFDLVKAAHFRSRACKLGVESDCFVKFSYWSEDKVALTDKAMARQDSQNACDAGNPNACFTAALIHDEPDLSTYLKKACDGGIGEGCMAYALNENPASTPKPSSKEILSLLEKGCELDSAWSCTALAIKLSDLSGSTQASKDKQRKAFARACALAGGKHCFGLAKGYATGGFCPQNDIAARSLLKISCATGFAEGCDSLAMFLQEGRGGPKDPKTARKAQLKACRLGHKLACK